MGNAKKGTYEHVPVVDVLADGQGLAKAEGRAIQVPDVMPGDVIRVEVKSKRKGLFRGKLLAVEEPSPERIEPRCEHFENCGGCKWQHMTYGAQLAFKQKHVADALRRVGGLPEEVNVPLPLPAPAVFNYRNKVEFSFSASRWLTRDEIASGVQLDPRSLGFHVAQFYDKVLDIRRCHLHEDRLNAVRNRLREIARRDNVPFYDIREQTGLLRNLVFRSSAATGEVMLLLIIAEDDPVLIDHLFGELRAEFPFITSWVWMVNPKKNDAYAELPWRVWDGPAVITEELGGYQFRISPTAFFQTNSGQAEQLYATVRGMIDGPAEVLYDLYCGTGTLGIFCAGKAERVVGLEYVEAAVTDARENAALNALPNASFFAGDLKKLLNERFVAANGQPEVVLTDPPRAGMAEEVVRELIRLAPRQIIYVSCKPASQARDLALLQEAYEVAAVQPVDMFPHTAHIENVLSLRRRAAAG